MSIIDVARTDVVTVEPETPAQEIARLMRDERIGSVVVVDGKGSVAGMVTDRDLVTYGLTADEDPRELIANDILAPHVFSVESDATVFDAVTRMSEEGVRRIPIVDDGELVGIVTLDDLVVLLSREFQRMASVIENESPPW
ncbi:MAG: cyclic nucleotide-binding/CBS domain-containing protein [Haloferacaceae archaeon]